MELAAAGRLILWLGVGLLAVGIFLSNTLILISAALLFLYLLFEGISFHRAVNRFKNSIKLESHPSTIETTVGRPFKLETVVTNGSPSRFSIARFSHNIPAQIGEEVHALPRLTLQSRGKQQIETLLTTKIPGRLEITTSTMLVERRGHVFSQAVGFPDKVIIIARPLVSRSVDAIETGVLADFAVDHMRRGTGTDLAGIRPSNILDNFHSIDWKSTARAGKLMTRESYLERDPTIMLMIDISSSMNTRRQQPSVLEGLLNEAGNLLAAIRPASPLGLILYDKRGVIENIEARQGVNSRERILRTLLERAKSTSAPAPLERRAIRPHIDLARETNSLIRGSALAPKTRAYWERFSSFASLILPFYQKAESKYFERAKRQGAFKAFESICTFPEPVFVIVISDGKTDLDGLVEGAKNAALAGHRVVLAILADPVKHRPADGFSELQEFGIQIFRTKPDQLLRTISAATLQMSHIRQIRATK